MAASEIVFTGILRGLEAQTLVPGQRLVEAEIAARHGVGRNSVREAFQRLEADGILELSRHRGAAIRQLTLRDTLDVLDVAERMTGLLARAATRGTREQAAVPQATPKTDPKVALRAAVQELVAADKAGDPERFATGRRDFYRSLLAMAESRELRRLFPSIQMPIVYAQYRLPGLQKLRLADYRRMARAVLGGDPGVAEAAGIAHVRNVREAILASRPAQMCRLSNTVGCLSDSRFHGASGHRCQEFKNAP